MRSRPDWRALVTAPPELDRAIRKLETHSRLGDAEREALRAMPFTRRRMEAGSYIVREGDRPDCCSILVSGFAYRQKLTGTGQRQIISIHFPGDLVDLQNLFLDVSDHNLQILTRADALFVAREVVREIAARFPGIGRALWTDTLVDASVFREWVLNVGRRDAVARIAHLLCEFSIRLEAVGLAREQAYELPMTQEQLADSVGLTPVHVNRVLRQLGDRGLIVRNKRSVSIPDWQKLAEIGDFNDRYLHLREDAAFKSMRIQAA